MLGAGGPKRPRICLDLEFTSKELTQQMSFFGRREQSLIEDKIVGL